MEYNTQREQLDFAEYGRNIKKMVEYALTIEDREKRTIVARAIVNVMSQVNPQSKDVVDFKHKLWDQLFVISDFKLDVDSPYPMIKKEELAEVKPEQLNYNGNHIKYRHYGRNMERVIAKVIEYPEGEEKDKLIELIAHNLKKSYLNWNRDSVNDELIYEQFNEMTNGKLKLSEDFQLLHTREYLSKNTKPKTNSGGKQFRGHQQLAKSSTNKSSQNGSSNSNRPRPKNNNNQKRNNNAK